jgi:DNA-directed RNA polymerase subunit E'/Rpb7
MDTASSKMVSIYNSSLISRKIYIPYTNLSNNISKTLEEIVKQKFEGKCCKEGFIKPNSCKIVNYSSGILREDKIIFDVVINCHICLPTEGMVIYCNVKNITKAGIKAEIDESPSPLIIFISRDHHYNIDYFSKVKEDEKILVKIIGQRFELNDNYISIIAELLEPGSKFKLKKKKISI